MEKTKLVDLAPDVERALVRGGPVVALESTVISHGLPHPTNFETALHLEEIVRSAGAVPATIAVLGGVLRAGLSNDEISGLATNSNIRKLSTRDLPLATAFGWDGATTVATTSWIAERAGIKVFATGGIGGVHRGGTGDVSADLPQLAESRMIVVCSGAKIILDLDATREWLETHGVTVLGFGTDTFPAFYSRESALPVDFRVERPEHVATVALARQKLGLKGAILVVVPVPVEDEVPGGPLAEALERALADAASHRIRGREITPFLLSKMSAHSEGATLKANIALLENNARIAAHVAVALANLTLEVQLQKSGNQSQGN